MRVERTRAPSPFGQLILAVILPPFLPPFVTTRSSSALASLNVGLFFQELFYAFFCFPRVKGWRWAAGRRGKRAGDARRIAVLFRARLLSLTGE